MRQSQLFVTQPCCVNPTVINRLKYTSLSHQFVNNSEKSFYKFDHWLMKIKATPSYYLTATQHFKKWRHDIEHNDSQHNDTHQKYFIATVSLIF
jgi:hypothetical protein